MNRKKITYSQVGDNYQTKDPVKILAQKAAADTESNLLNNNFKPFSGSRGESAFVWEQDNVLMASVIEGLGTKNLVADEMRKITGKTYYDHIGYDTVATIINDLATVGALPLVVHAYWAVGSNDWIEDKERMVDLINGWKKACDDAGATWGGGETPTLKGIVNPETIDLGGSAVGIIKKKGYLVTDEKLETGDRIILLKSNGINANGLSLSRAIAKNLSKGYATLLDNGKSYGEELLKTTNIYAQLIQFLLEAGIDIHYISNITGHGLRKIMRARKDFSYVIDTIYPCPELFKFIQKHGNLSDEEMYGTFNMGMDYAIFLDRSDVKKTLKIIKKTRFEGIEAGFVEKGERKVGIKPKNIVFDSKTLDLR